LSKQCQDILQTKSALAAIFESSNLQSVACPVIAQVTIEAFGTMLMGTEIAAAYTAIEPFPIDVVGMNCATGPQQMAENIRYLCQNSKFPVSVIPECGIPENVGGHAVFKETPESLAKELAHFARDLRRQYRRRVLRHDTGALKSGRRSSQRRHAR
jgi:5-methyltetrahydrofolate--homocysteine methyltransferase